VRLRQEQVVFLGTIAVLGMIVLSPDREAKKRRGERRGSGEAALVTQAVPDVSQALPDGHTLAGARELFVPPSDTRPLPALELDEVPREEPVGLLPPTDPGPAPRAYGDLLRHRLGRVERPELFDPPAADAGGELSGPSDGDLETPAEELAR